MSFCHVIRTDYSSRTLERAIEIRVTIDAILVHMCLGMMPVLL